MRNTFWCRLTNGACTSYQYFWNSCVDRPGSRRRQNTIFIISATFDMASARNDKREAQLKNQLVQLACIVLEAGTQSAIEKVDVRLVDHTQLLHCLSQIRGLDKCLCADVVL